MEGKASDHRAWELNEDLILLLGGEWALKWRQCHPWYKNSTPANHRQFEVDPLLDVLEDTLPADAIVYV